MSETSKCGQITNIELGNASGDSELLTILIDHSNLEDSKQSFLQERERRTKFLEPSKPPASPSSPLGSNLRRASKFARETLIESVSLPQSPKSGKDSREIDTLISRSIITRGDLIRSNHSVVSWGKKIVLFGGIGEGGIFCNTVGVYCVDQGKDGWKLSTPKCQNKVIEARANHSAVVHQRKMYVYGGHNDKSFFDDFLVCDLETMVWKIMQGDQKTNTPRSRFGHAAAVCQQMDKMFIAGGMYLEETSCNVFEYAFVRKTWTKVRGPSMSTLNQVANVHLCCQNGTLYLMGLKGSHLTPLTVHMMNTLSREWTQVVSTGTSPQWHRISGCALTNPVLIPKRNQWLFYVCADQEEKRQSVQLPILDNGGNKTSKKEMGSKTYGSKKDVNAFALNLSSMQWRHVNISGVKLPAIQIRQDFHTKYRLFLYNEYVVLQGGTTRHDYFFSVLTPPSHHDTPFKPLENLATSIKKAEGRMVVAPPPVTQGALNKPRFMVPSSGSYASTNKSFFFANKAPFTYITYDEEEKWETQLYKLQRDWLLSKYDEVMRGGPMLPPERHNPSDNFSIIKPKVMEPPEFYGSLSDDLSREFELQAVSQSPDNDSLSESDLSASKTVDMLNKKAMVSSADLMCYPIVYEAVRDTTRKGMPQYILTKPKERLVMYDVFQLDMK